MYTGIYCSRIERPCRGHCYTVTYPGAAFREISCQGEQLQVLADRLIGTSSKIILPDNHDQQIIADGTYAIVEGIGKCQAVPGHLPDIEGVAGKPRTRPDPSCRLGGKYQRRAVVTDCHLSARIDAHRIR